MTTEEIIIERGPIDLSDLLENIAPGYDWAWSFYVLDDNDNPQDTTGYSCEIKLRDKPNGEVKATLSTTGGEIVNTPSQGLYSITWSAADNADLDCQQIVFDVKLTDASGGVHRPFKGTVDVDEVVT